MVAPPMDHEGLRSGTAPPRQVGTRGRGWNGCRPFEKPADPYVAEHHFVNRSATADRSCAASVLLNVSCDTLISSKTRLSQVRRMIVSSL